MYRLNTDHRQIVFAISCSCLQADDASLEETDFDEDNEEGLLEYNPVYHPNIMDAILGEEDLSDEGEEDRVEEVEEEIFDEISDLKEWAKQKNIRLDALDSLLGILRQRLLPTLPKCGKFFLKTTSAKHNIDTYESGRGGRELPRLPRK